MRRAVLLLIKAAVSICLLYLALRSIHPGALIARMKAADPAWIAAAVILLALQAAVVGLRWRMVARPLTDRLTAAVAIELSFIGVFFSQARACATLSSARRSTRPMSFFLKVSAEKASS